MPSDRRYIPDQLETLLRRSGLSHTRARRALHDCLRMAPATTGQMVVSLEGNIHKSSVYRNLTALQSAGVIQRRTDGYWHLTDYLAQHYHICVCRICGLQVRFWNEKIELALDAYSGPGQFVVEDHALELRGLCTQCLDLPQTAVRPRIGTRLRKVLFKM